MKRKPILLPVLMTAALALTSCVSTADFEAMVKERDTAVEKNTALSEQVSSLQDAAAHLKGLVEKVEERRAAEAEKAALMEAELARQNAVYARLQETFATEQAANQVKIEMLKSGIKVNLANEILFSSGSSRLNAQGREVLKRAAGDLKETPYQVLVAGFTDNVEISDRLKKKFPSNWELAGARAASVVRLLEEGGVPPEQLLVISLGQNSPVEPNDTPEGRAKNRRIEIMLRPEPVTLD